MSSKKNTQLENKSSSSVDIDICNSCSKPILLKEKGLQLEICADWYHAKCVGITDEIYNCLNDNDNLYWYCSHCNKGAVKQHQEMSKLY